MAMQPNIVQVEFFHVGGEETSSINALLCECGERVKEGFELVSNGIESTTGIKTVVRFYDETGDLTELALNAEMLRKKHESTVASYFRTKSWWQRWWLDRKARKLVGNILTVKKKARELSIDHLRNAVENSRDIAVHRLDRTFRHARKNELHDLLARAQHSKKVWLFVFSPKKRLLDTGRLIASLM